MLRQARRPETLTEPNNTTRLLILARSFVVRNLNFELKQLCDRNHDGSFASRADRSRLLSQAAAQLERLGFRDMHATSLKPKHVAALLNKWRADGISTGAMKNRMSALRWWAEKIGKENIIERSNAAYGIEQRKFVTNVSKAKVVDRQTLDRVKDAYTAASLRLQAAFGLRREESIKIDPKWADQVDYLRLKDSWTKGGKYREIPITNKLQREALDHAKQVAKGGSLIPGHMNYRGQLQRFRSECNRVGINGVHGLRHKYAQDRYKQLTGWAAPAAGGPKSKALSAKDKAIDLAARLALSKELGHGREQITAVYLGR
nr:phage integrase N-terminal domain-containing protein [Massilia sp. TS11]